MINDTNRPARALVNNKMICAAFSIMSTLKFTTSYSTTQWLFDKFKLYAKYSDTRRQAKPCYFKLLFSCEHLCFLSSYSYMPYLLT